jgi:DNA replication protein DnaC
MNSSANSTRTETCPIHGAYEAKVIHLGEREIVMPCDPCAAKANADRAEAEKARFIADRARQETERRARMFENSGVPYRYREKGFDGFRAMTPQQERALAYSRQFAAAIVADQRSGVSSIFTGNVGTGKTHLACGIVRAVCEGGIYARFETVLSAIRSIKDTYRRDSEVSETDAIESLAAPSLLVFDEVGVQFDTDHERTLFFEVLNNRYQECRSTLLLSNLTLGELQTFLGDRVIDRFRENGKVLAFGWESQRGKAQA